MECNALRNQKISSHVVCALFFSFSDLCTPVGELTRLARVHSTSWEEKGEVMRKLRTDFESMQRQLSIALKRIEMMAAEVCVCRHK